MSEIIYFIVFVFGLVFGTVFLLLGRRRGQAWFEAFRPTALLFGMSGFTGGQIFLGGTLGLVASFAFLLPALAVSASHTREQFSRRERDRLPTSLHESESAAELAIAHANRADHMEVNAKIHRRFIRNSVMVGLPFIGIGAFYGSWPVILAGGATMILSGLLGRFVTKPLRDPLPPSAATELGEAPAQTALPEESSP